MPDARIRAAGDAAVMLELPPSLDLATSERIVALSAAVRERCGSLIRDAVIGFHTLTVYYDPLAVDVNSLEAQLSSIAADDSLAARTVGTRVDVPVCYGGDLGPDLAEVAALTGRTEAEVVALHSGREYRVFVVGFVPGFAYMGILDPPLSALPRRSTPRTRVPAGSVAIAAGQTGIYPMETPGGWHLLGRTPIRPFDPTRREPVLFRPGDRVRFQPIDRDTFDRMMQ